MIAEYQIAGCGLWAQGASYPGAGKGTDKRTLLLFTLSEALNPLCLYQPEKMYNALFKAAWSVVKGFAGRTWQARTAGKGKGKTPYLSCVQKRRTGHPGYHKAPWASCFLFPCHKICPRI